MVIMNDHYTPTIKPLERVNDPQLQRSRRVLLIMLGICLGLCLIIVFVAIVNYTENSQTNTSVVGPIVLIALYGFGLLVSYDYSGKGLRV
ncbi:unnamed protein product, partial [Adineta steineri]